MKEDTAIIKKLVIVAILVAAITVSIIAFVGVFVRDTNKMTNAIPNYTLGTEFEGNKEYEFVLSKSESEKEVYVNEDGKICGEVVSNSSNTSDLNVTVEGDENVTVNEDDNNNEGYKKETRTIKDNEDDVLTPDCYKKSKKIIEDRLEKIGVAEYNVRLDEESGKLVVEIPDDDESDFIYEIISSNGKFSIIDSQTGLELMDNSRVKNATVNYGSENGSYKVYLQIEFDKEGAGILKDISNTYIEKEVPEEESEESNDVEGTETAETTDTTEESSEPKTEISYIEIKLDDSNLMKTYFSEEFTGGVIQIPINSNITDSDELRKALKSTGAIATILNSGKLPNKYELENDDFLKSTIKEKDIEYVKIAFAIIVAFISFILLIKFGLKGLVGAILNVGFLGLVSLAIRYTNVTITISSFAAVLLIILLNSVFIYNLLSNLKKGKTMDKAFSETTKNYYLSIIPICIVAFVFSFMQSAVITGIGMVLFWGLIIQVIYNLIFTRTVYVVKGK